MAQIFINVRVSAMACCLWPIASLLRVLCGNSFAVGTFFPSVLRVPLCRLWLKNRVIRDRNPPFIPLRPSRTLR